nr:unnamed protein product [Callosobruchus analis]
MEAAFTVNSTSWISRRFDGRQFAPVQLAHGSSYGVVSRFEQCAESGDSSPSKWTYAKTFCETAIYKTACWNTPVFQRYPVALPISISITI